MKIQALIHYLVVVVRRAIVKNFPKIKRLFAIILAILSLISFLPMLSDQWRPKALEFWSNFFNALPAFFSFFIDFRAFILYLIIAFIWVLLVYFKHEAHFLKLSLENKKEIADELPKIKKLCPTGHYLGLIIGKLNTTALDVKDQKGTNIISAIDKNIKKYERVYWIAEDEIGIIFYELANKDESSFINVIKNKLAIEIGETEAKKFLDDINFAMTKITLENPDLLKCESSARIALNKKLQEKAVT